MLEEAPRALLAPRLIEVAGPFIIDRPQRRIGSAQEDIMAKGQVRSNREVRKPKKKKEAVAAPAGMTKGISASTGIPKKKA